MLELIWSLTNGQVVQWVWVVGMVVGLVILISIKCYCSILPITRLNCPLEEVHTEKQLMIHCYSWWHSPWALIKSLSWRPFPSDTFSTSLVVLPVQLQLWQSSSSSSSISSNIVEADTNTEINLSALCKLRSSYNLSFERIHLVSLGKRPVSRSRCPIAELQKFECKQVKKTLTFVLNQHRKYDLNNNTQ